LGNPGERYARTRHNIGAMVVQRMAEVAGVRLKAQRKVRCDAADARLGGQRLLLAVPHSYMNESGGPVSALLGYYSVPPERLIVVHDEIDLPFAALRLKLGGGDNGHNGLKSIRSALGTGDWFRVRVGVGRGRGEQADHVLSGFSGAQRKELPELLDRSSDAVETLVGTGLAAAQNAYNS
jgi:PTH1 family peptidyl-tRNA hydrolase